MNRSLRFWIVLFFAAALVGCGRPSGSMDSRLAQFVRTKETQAHALAQMYGAKLPRSVDELFAAILAGDSRSATNCFARLERLSVANPRPWELVHDWLTSHFGIPGRQANSWAIAWEPIREAYWAFVLTKNWESNRLQTVVREITQAIGTNSIYFGGTDVGRFAVTAAMESHEQGKPSFVLTQNQLCDGWYREYASSMFSNQVYIPTHDDFAEAYRRYLVDAEHRLQAGQLRVEEKVTVGADGAVNVSGSGAYWELAGRLLKLIVDKNEGREIFIEQSEPLHWTHPRLVPAGPIFRLSREPLEHLSDEIIHSDRAYWSNRCRALIGDWISERTTFLEIAEFAERTYLQNELIDFQGDPSYIHERVAQEYYSKLRRSGAELYVWRCVQATAAEEKSRMWTEALIAMKQALALAPGSFETATYVKNVLVDVSQYDEAIAVMRISAALNPAEDHLRAEMVRLQKLKFGPHP